jgi:predicted AAA+ superfamily ATPase
MINRYLAETIKQKLFKGKTIILTGARQTGKTTLIRQIIKSSDEVIVLNCDEIIVREKLSNPNTSELKQIIGTAKLVFMDEAQRVKNIGLTLKLIHDQFRDVQLIVSGSSALELSDEINEPLTGRKWEYNLYTISWGELVNHSGYLEAQSQLEQRIIYGMYPDVINHPGEEEEILYELSDSYLYKDLLTYKGIRKPDLLDKLVRALALQIGSEVSYNELANLLQVDKNTVQTYIDLLEKSFVVFRLPAFSRNIRNEISTGKKIYFYDTGIRNAVISDFAPLELRTDKGALWENFLISERLKTLHYKKIRARMYFWRTTTQSEIDYLEESGSILNAWEFKWNKRSKVKTPAAFRNAYNLEAKLVSPQNFSTFLENDDIQ